MTELPENQRVDFDLNTDNILYSIEKKFRHRVRERAKLAELFHSQPPAVGRPLKNREKTTKIP
jgi:hypothetical protein